MSTERNKVGRPPMLASERKHKQAVSVTDATLEKARKYFGTLGKAIEFAVEVKDKEAKTKQ